MAVKRMVFSVALLFCLLLLSSALSASSAVNSPPFYPDKTKLLVYRDDAGREHPIRAANYPGCGHNFPPEARQVAYGWLDHWLKTVK